MKNKIDLLKSEGWEIFVENSYLPRVHKDIVEYVLKEKQDKIDALEMKLLFKDSYIKHMENNIDEFIERWKKPFKEK